MITGYSGDYYTSDCDKYRGDDRLDNMFRFDQVVQKKDLIGIICLDKKISKETRDEVIFPFLYIYFSLIHANDRPNNSCEKWLDLNYEPSVSISYWSLYLQSTTRENFRGQSFVLLDRRNSNR
jgi:hypothetical protein